MSNNAPYQWPSVLLKNNYLIPLSHKNNNNNMTRSISNEYIPRGGTANTSVCLQTDVRDYPASLRLTCGQHV